MSTITPMPTAPTRTDPNTFSARADAWDAALVLLGPEINVVAGEVNANAVSAVAAAVAALASQTSASGSAAAAAASVATVGTAWVSGTTYAIGNIRYSPINFASYCRKTTGAGTTDPSLDSTNWAPSVIVAGTGGVISTTSITLTVSSSAAMSITPATPGLYVTLPDATTCQEGSNLFSVFNTGNYDYGVKNSVGTILGWVRPRTGAIIGLGDNTTGAGVWVPIGLEKLGVTATYVNATVANQFGAASKFQRIALDANRSLLLFGGTDCYGIVYDASTQTWGTATLIRATVAGFIGLLSATNQVLVCSCDSTTGFEAVTLTVATNTITVNTGTKATATLAGNYAAFGQFIAVGTSWVVSYGRATTVSGLRALTVSGTTPTIGAESAQGVSAATGANLFASGAVVRTINIDATSAYCNPFTVSTSTLTAGTPASATASQVGHRAFLNGNGNIVCEYINSTHFASIFKLTGTVEAVSSVTLGPTPNNVNNSQTDYVAVSAGKTAFGWHGGTGSFYAQIITDTAGTISAGTMLTVSTNGTAQYICAAPLNGSIVPFMLQTSTAAHLISVACSTASPTLSNVVSSGMSNSFAYPPVGTDKFGNPAFNALYAGLHAYILSGFTYAFDTRFGTSGIARTVALATYGNPANGGVMGATASEKFLSAPFDNNAIGINIQRIEAAA